MHQRIMQFLFINSSLCPNDCPTAILTKADMGICTAHGRFRGQSGHAFLHCKCLLLTQSYIRTTKQPALIATVTACWFEVAGNVVRSSVTSDAKREIGRGRSYLSKNTCACTKRF